MCHLEQVFCAAFHRVQLLASSAQQQQQGPASRLERVIQTPFLFKDLNILQISSLKGNWCHVYFMYIFHIALCFPLYALIHIELAWSWLNIIYPPQLHRCQYCAQFGCASGTFIRSQTPWTRNILMINLKDNRRVTPWLCRRMCVMIVLSIRWSIPLRRSAFL